jgi:hypothetical protein
MRHWAALAIALVLSAAASAAAGAETINIVAFGDSGVFGSGQGRTPAGVPVGEGISGQARTRLACERLGRVGIQPGRPWRHGA